MVNNIIYFRQIIQNFFLEDNPDVHVLRKLEITRLQNGCSRLSISGQHVHHNYF